MSEGMLAQIASPLGAGATRNHMPFLEQSIMLLAKAASTRRATAPGGNKGGDVQRATWSAHSQRRASANTAPPWRRLWPPSPNTNFIS